MKSCMVILFGAALSCFADPVTDLGGVYANVVSVGCDINGHSCNATLDQDLQTNCTYKRTVRWSLSQDPNGKAVLALFMQAKALGQAIKVYTNSCWSSDGGFPTPTNVAL